MGEGKQSDVRIDIVSISSASLLACIGFGFLNCWMWLGLLLGFPAFGDGFIDSLSVVALLGGFATYAFATGFSDSLRKAVLRWEAALVLSMLAMLACGIGAAIDMGMFACSPVLGSWIMRLCSLFIGVAAAALLQCHFLYFCRFALSESFFGYCLSFGGTFLAFFLVHSLNLLFSEAVFSFLPVASVLMLKPGFHEVAETGSATFEGSGGYPRSFTRMALSFAVCAFAASLSQSFEPAKDFGMSVDVGMVFFAILIAAAFCTMVSGQRKVETMTVLEAFYQIAMILLVIKLVLQSLASEDSYFAAFNNMTWFLMFATFWLLAVLIGRMREVPPAKAFALVFGIGVVSMAAAWLIGGYLYGIFGWGRTYISVAAGCVVAVFCTFGFSAKDFSHLAKPDEDEGAGVAGVGEVDGVGRIKPVTMQEALDDLADEFGLSAREKEIAALIVSGMDAQRVAESLTISYYTVRTHMRNIYAKFKVGSKNELMLLVIQRKSELSGETDG